MSQPPFPSPPTLMYQPHQPSQRPTAVTVLAIIGIVVGGLGVLCLGWGLLFQLITFMNPKIAASVNRSAMGPQALHLTLALVGLVLNGVLLFGSIGSLMLKPASRRLMVGWAAVDIAYDLIKMAITFLVMVPRMAQNPAFAQNPGMIPMMRGITIASVLLTGIVAMAYAIFVAVFFRKPEVIAAFERGSGGFDVQLPRLPNQP